ncbi:tetraspanin-18 [Cynara cardunculus var. scolymus]|uniref:Tetraspanin/Peripherin n=1 Tax=Cynara cardunculus var. scolymus TaxID=59895 RepID=A0A118JW85_CYNCS|nr:tetraspanin-18 [Cynara cardunculus var. scolymus]KVH94254.1 Tetraspanin/Peripherin [Cynara cardunculus var. scolymus]
MRTPCCHTFVAFILKFLIFFQTFIGISIIVYSAYMLNQWEKHLPIPPAPPSPSPSPPSPSPPSPSPSPLPPPPPSDLAPAPSPDSSEFVFSVFNTGIVSGQVIRLNFGADTITGIHGGIKLDSNPIPAPWFIYAFMGLGIVLCCISCIGHIAAEAINGCCLCFYTILKSVLILLEVALVVFIALDHRWEKDLPQDPTGEIASMREFIEDNIDLCKWVGIAIIVIQAVCLLLAILLGMMVSSLRKDDMEEGLDSRGRAWEPLLNPHPNQASGSTGGDGKAFHSDIWSLRMREKYGLNGNQSNPSAPVDRKV